VAIGGFSEKLVTCEDIDVCYRLRARYSIVNEPCLRAVHLGEAPTLASFFAKEVWRGRDNLRGALAHRLEASELPSLALPFYYQVGLAAVAVGLGYACLTGRTLAAGLSLLALIAPAAGTALATAIVARAPRYWLPLAMLYAA